MESEPIRNRFKSIPFDFKVDESRTDQNRIGTESEDPINLPNLDYRGKKKEKDVPINSKNETTSIW